METMIEGGHWPRMIVTNREQYEAWVRAYRAADLLLDYMQDRQVRAPHGWMHWYDSKSGIVSEQFSV